MGQGFGEARWDHQLSVVEAVEVPEDRQLWQGQLSRQQSDGQSGGAV